MLLFNQTQDVDQRVEQLDNACRNIFALISLTYSSDRDLSLAAIVKLFAHIGTKVADDCLASLDLTLVREAGLLSRATSASASRGDRVQAIFSLIRGTEFVRPDADEEAKRQQDLERLGTSIQAGR